MTCTIQDKLVKVDYLSKGKQHGISSITNLLTFERERKEKQIVIYTGVTKKGNLFFCQKDDLDKFVKKLKTEKVIIFNSYKPQKATSTLSQTRISMKENLSNGLTLSKRRISQRRWILCGFLSSAPTRLSSLHLYYRAIPFT